MIPAHLEAVGTVDDEKVFVAALDAVAKTGAVFIVHGPGDLEIVGNIAGWTGEVLTHWADFIECIDAARHQGRHFVACDECCELMLLDAEHVGSRCADALRPECPGTFTTRPPITFINTNESETK